MVGQRLAAVFAGTLAALVWSVVPSPAAADDGAAAVLRAGAAALGAAAHAGALYTSGTLAMAGQPGTFTSWLDLADGHTVSHAVVGPLIADRGYDGQEWSASNGITTVDDLPATRAQSITRVYLALDAWARSATAAAISDLGTRVDGGKTYRAIRIVPAGGLPATLWFDSTSHRLARTDLQTDAGTMTDRYADYRAVDGLQVPFRDVNRAPDGTVSASVVTEAKIEALPTNALARTPPVERGSIANGAFQARVPFRLSLGDTGNVVLPVSIAKPAPVFMVFDTGGRNVLTPAAARALGISGGGGLNVGGVGESTERATLATVGTMSAGDAVLVDQHAFVLPLPFTRGTPFAHETLAGLIGFEMLFNFQTTIDYARRTITFAPFATPGALPADATVVRFLSDGSTPYVEAAIDGVTGLFMVDTGNAGNLVVFKSFADAHHLFTGAKSVSYVGAGGVGGTLPVRRLRAQRLALAGTTLRSPIVEVTDQKTGAFASQTLAGNIGAAVLARFTMQLNYRDRTIAFAPNARASDPFSADRTGLSLARDAKGLLVLGVALQTPASAAGLTAGDRIVAIDATPIDDLSAADIFRTVRDPNVATIVLSVIRKGANVPTNVTIAPRDLL